MCADRLGSVGGFMFAAWFVSGRAAASPYNRGLRCRASFDLDIYRGDTGRWSFLLWKDQAKTDPVDLTGAAVRAQVRAGVGGAVLVDLGVQHNAAEPHRRSPPGGDERGFGAGSWVLGPGDHV